MLCHCSSDASNLRYVLLQGVRYMYNSQKLKHLNEQGLWRNILIEISNDPTSTPILFLSNYAFILHVKSDKVQSSLFQNIDSLHSLLFEINQIQQWPVLQTPVFLFVQIKKILYLTQISQAYSSAPYVNPYIYQAQIIGSEEPASEGIKRGGQIVLLIPNRLVDASHNLETNKFSELRCTNR